MESEKQQTTRSDQVRQIWLMGDLRSNIKCPKCMGSGTVYVELARCSGMTQVWMVCDWCRG